MSFGLSSSSLWGFTGASIGLQHGYSLAKSLFPERDQRRQLVDKSRLYTKRAIVILVESAGFGLLMNDLATRTTSAAEMNGTCSLTEVALSVSIATVAYFIINK